MACIENDVLLQIRSTIIDKNYLLLGTSSGLLRVKINTSNLDQIGQKFQWVNFSAKNRINIFDATLRKDGSIWILTEDALHGMAFHNESNNPLIIESVVDKRFTNNIAIKEDKFGNLWIITHGKGFCRYNPTTKELDYFTENLSNRTVVSSMYSDVATDRNDNLWIASRDKGLLFLDASRLNDENPQFENIQNDPSDEKSLNSNLVYSLYVSKDNLLWVGTIGSGINIYDPQQKEIAINRTNNVWEYKAFKNLNGHRNVLFDNWWDGKKVLSDKFKYTFTRKDLICKVANTDGGAHVDPSIHKDYNEVSRNNSLDWFIIDHSNDNTTPLNNPIPPCIRQIAYKVIMTFQNINIEKSTKLYLKN